MKKVIIIIITCIVLLSIYLGIRKHTVGKPVRVTDMTFEHMEKYKENPAYLEVTFKDRDGLEKSFVVHEIYKDDLEQGVHYNFYYIKKEFLRPDNELTELTRYRQKSF